MKVFFDSKIFINQTHGGPTNYFINLCNKLDKFCTYDIISPLHLNHTLQNFKRKNNVYGYKIPFSENLIKYNSVKKILHKINFKLINKRIKRSNYDILHTTFYENYPYDLNYNNKIVKVVTIFDLISEKFSSLYGKRKNFLPKKKILDNCDKIICISKNTKKDLQEIYDIPPEKMEVIYLGHPDKLENLKNEFNFPYILYVGTRWKYKNFERFINAYSINHKINSNFKLVIFGGGKFTESEFDIFKKYNIKNEDIIHLSGDNDILFRCYQFASLFVYPTLYEGFGLPILESMVYGCPVACSNTSSLPEVAGNAALYFNPKYVDEISDKMEQILFSNDTKNLLIKNGKNQLKKFSWDICAEETFEFYNK